MTNAERLAKDKSFLWSLAQLIDNNCNHRETCDLCVFDGECKFPYFIDNFDLVRWLNSESKEGEE